MFIVLCFPLGCFMPCQPHGVVSKLDINVFSDNDETFWISLENFLSSTCTYWRQFNSETVPNGEPSSSSRLCRYTPFMKIIHIRSFGSFFLSIKRIDSIWKKWKLQDSNLWLVGYEPTVLPTELSFLSRGLLQFKSNFLCCCGSCPLSRNKGSNAVLHKQSPSGTFEAPLIIPVGIDGTNLEGNYIMAKQYSPTRLAGFEPANTAVKVLFLTAWR